MATTTPSLYETLHYYFAPFPGNPSLQAQEKDALDHVADYVNPTGAWDVFRVFNHALSYLNFIPSIARQHSELVARVITVVDTAGISLSVPQIIFDGNTLRRSISNLITVKGPSSNDREVAQAAKKSFLDAMNLTNALAQAALVIDQTKIVALKTVRLVALNSVLQATTLITDGAELVGEYYKLEHYRSPQADPHRLEEKKTLAWIVIAKDVASVALSSIALAAIAIGIDMQAAPLIAGAVLVLSTVWLAMKLASHFYNKIVVEAPIPSPTF
jgi:hypothetical protein